MNKIDLSKYDLQDVRDVAKEITGATAADWDGRRLWLFKTEDWQPASAEVTARVERAFSHGTYEA